MKPIHYIHYIWILLLLTLPLSAGTKIWEHLSAKDFEVGEFKNTQLASDGTIQIGFELQRNKSPEASIWSYAYSDQGDLFLGTGTRGIVYLFDNGSFKEFYKTGTLLVTSMLVIGEYLYIATIPEGKIFKVSIHTGEGKLWHTLPTGYIWGIANRGQSLIAGTGPEGILYQISLDSEERQILLKSEEKHILSLAVDKKDNIYIGTEPNALLIKISPNNQALVLADLIENEIRSIALGENKIYLGANVTKNFDNTKLVQNLAREIEQQSSQNKPVNRKELLQKMISGAVYEFQENIGIRSILPLPKNTVTTLASYKNGVLIGTGMDGYVYHAVANDQVTLLADLREDQVMSLVMDKGNIQYLGTGDTGILYRLEPANSVSYYYSPILDATGLSKWGRMVVEKQGNLLIQTRSGNTQTPDSFWTGWSNLKGEKIISPIGRYLQYRIAWGGAEGIVTSVRIYYNTINRPPNISSFKIEGPKEDNSRLFSMKHDKKLKISWKGEDEDKDELIYSLDYRNTETSVWYPIGTQEILTKPNYTWDTSLLPDGYYLFRVTASDESDNAIPAKTYFTSKPILVDNNIPIIIGQRTENKIIGRVYDSFSCIAKISYRVGNTDWISIEPDDGIYDDSTENFMIILEKTSNERVEIRAIDSNNNVSYRLIQ